MIVEQVIDSYLFFPYFVRDLALKINNTPAADERNRHPANPTERATQTSSVAALFTQRNRQRNRHSAKQIRDRTGRANPTDVNRLVA
jgi:hypothetical protein